MKGGNNIPLSESKETERMLSRSNLYIKRGVLSEENRNRFWSKNTF